MDALPAMEDRADMTATPAAPDTLMGADATAERTLSAADWLLGDSVTFGAADTTASTREAAAAALPLLRFVEVFNPLVRLVRIDACADASALALLLRLARFEVTCAVTALTFVLLPVKDAREIGAGGGAGGEGGLGGGASGGLGATAIPEMETPVDARLAFRLDTNEAVPEPELIAVRALFRLPAICVDAAATVNATLTPLAVKRRPDGADKSVTPVMAMA